MNSSDLGYILDLTAGFFVIQSIILRSKRHIERESSAFWDANPFVFESQLHAFWDGWFAVAQLMLATLFHFYYFEMEQKVFLLIVLLIALIGIEFYLISKRMILEFVKKKYPNYEAARKSFEDKNYLYSGIDKK